jgi:hypothetical protein
VGECISYGARRTGDSETFDKYVGNNGKLYMKVAAELAGVVPHSRLLCQAIKRDVLICAFMRNISLVDSDTLEIYVVIELGA